MTLHAKKQLDTIKPYVPGAFEAGAVKLSSNENPLGCSDQAKEAYKKAADDLAFYPDGGCNELREALAKTHGLKKEEIVVGAGSDEMIRTLFHAFAKEGDEIIYPECDFLMYPLSTQVNGAKQVPVKDMNFHLDPHSIIDKITDKTRMIIFSNPHVPAGSFLSYDEICGLISRISSDILVVLDAAYAEYMFEGDDYNPGHELVRTYENVVVLRTFSKAYGLAGLRVGWAHASSSVIDALNCVRGAFNVSMPAQKAAIAALSDQAFVKKTRDYTAEVRNDFIVKLTGMGFHVYPSHTNFILVDFGSDERANIVRNYLKNNKVLVRPMGFCNLGHCLRFSVGLKEDMDMVASLLKEMA